MGLYLTGMFVETARKIIVAIAGGVITNARYIEIKMMNYIHKEVNQSQINDEFRINGRCKCLEVTARLQDIVL